MKVGGEQYAQALYELTKDKPENEVAVVIEKFVGDLRREGLLNKSGEIIKKFTKIYNNKNRIVVAKVVVSREFSDEKLKEIEDSIKRRYKAKEVELYVMVNKALKGGVKIIVGEEILDNSVAGRLTNLRMTLVG